MATLTEKDMDRAQDVAEEIRRPKIRKAGGHHGFPVELSECCGAEVRWKTTHTPTGGVVDDCFCMECLEQCDVVEIR